MRLPTFLSLALAATPVLAHDGHGLFESHWHASDAWGFALIGVLVAAAWWTSRGR